MLRKKEKGEKWETCRCPVGAESRMISENLQRSRHTRTLQQSQVSFDDCRPSDFNKKRKRILQLNLSKGRKKLEKVPSNKRTAKVCNRRELGVLRIKEVAPLSSLRNICRFI
jgi:hypothetical protein